jgi:serine/threonine protein phosphatase PrpC
LTFNLLHDKVFHTMVQHEQPMIEHLYEPVQPGWTEVTSNEPLLSAEQAEREYNLRGPISGTISLSGQKFYLVDMAEHSQHVTPAPIKLNRASGHGSVPYKESARYDYALISEETLQLGAELARDSEKQISPEDHYKLGYFTLGYGDGASTEIIIGRAYSERFRVPGRNVHLEEPNVHKALTEAYISPRVADEHADILMMDDRRVWVTDYSSGATAALRQQPEIEPVVITLQQGIAEQAPNKLVFGASEPLAVIPVEPANAEKETPEKPSMSAPAQAPAGFSEGVRIINGDTPVTPRRSGMPTTGRVARKLMASEVSVTVASRASRLTASGEAGAVIQISTDPKSLLENPLIAEHQEKTSLWSRVKQKATEGVDFFGLRGGENLVAVTLTYELPSGYGAPNVPRLKPVEQLRPRVSAGKSQEAIFGEDRIMYDDHAALFGVFDGFGGYNDGRDAATLAADTFYLTLRSRNQQDTITQAQQALVSSFEQTHKAILEYNKDNESNSATDALVARVVGGQDRSLVWAALGNSELYIRRADGVTQRLTMHQRDAALPMNILGHAEQSYQGVEQSGVESVRPDDVVVLMSDGVSDVNQAEIERILANHADDPQTAAEELVKLAKKHDDRSVIVFKI